MDKERISNITQCHNDTVSALKIIDLDYLSSIYSVDNEIKIAFRKVTDACGGPSKVESIGLDSLKECVIKLIRNGLSLLNDEAYIYPKGGKFIFVISPSGYKTLLYRYTDIVDLNAYLIFKGDVCSSHYCSEKGTWVVTHEASNLESQTQDVIGAYVSFVYNSGRVYTSRPESISFLNKYDTKIGSWKTNKNEMFLKTVLKKEARNKIPKVVFVDSEEENDEPIVAPNSITLPAGDIVELSRNVDTSTGEIVDAPF